MAKRNSGKSTYLVNEIEGEVTDVCLDDVNGVYVAKPWDQVDPGSQAMVVMRALEDVVVHNSASLDVAVLQDQIEATIGGKGGQKRKARLAKLVVDAIAGLNAVERGLTAENKSETHAEFQFRAIGRAIRESHSRMEALMAEGVSPLAWGNTNAKLKDMRSVVAMARDAQYAVEFVVLPLVGSDELMTRNLRRMWLTGKYIPIEAIDRTAAAIERMLAGGELSVDRVLGGEQAPRASAGKGKASGRKSKRDISVEVPTQPVIPAAAPFSGSPARTPHPMFGLGGGGWWAGGGLCAPGRVLPVHSVGVTGQATPRMIGPGMHSPVWAPMPMAMPMPAAFSHAGPSWPSPVPPPTAPWAFTAFPYPAYRASPGAPLYGHGAPRWS
ncbi:uncharacterized protein AMSG_06900 [Thecamonas trahens ATCC 50062]|uniref:Uncharacterized protein n=1 Tax=Thecamonas trahens ATCC 50062 TaxID=461836 RepID=A0A0L0DDM0_THETB|nr:hypothetical protein AMSG_06900 [Thecamonas trahens ATCC 50062]KNC50409.1 hypothetical protein AMSG_06900 [Thecamonas trahens ATCC 50062]|eukprot:XP_013756951.1 hypothetical protein AMSG_06900 [Thecamonas trahens ATCC 50062]